MKQPVRIIIVCFLLLYGGSVISEQALQLNPLPDVPINSATSIERDIKLLAGKGKKVTIAGERLINRGNIILEYAHAALLKEEITSKQKDLLVYILGRIKNDKSVHPIINFAMSMPDNEMVNGRVLSVLKNFEQSEDIVRYVNGVLDDGNRNPELLRVALEYFSVRPHKRAYYWAKKYSEPDIDMRVRSMALYLGALLSIDDFKVKIVKALKNKNTNLDEGYMLIGLADLVTPGEFNSIVKGMNVNKTSVAVARLHYYLNKGSKKDRRIAAVKIVRGRQKFLLKDAVNYLISIGDAESLVHLWRTGDRTVVSLVSEAGYSIETSVKGAKFVKKSLEGEGKTKKSEMSAEDFDKFCEKGVANVFDRHCTY